MNHIANNWLIFIASITLVAIAPWPWCFLGLLPLMWMD